MEEEGAESEQTSQQYPPHDEANARYQKQLDDLPEPYQADAPFEHTTERNPLWPRKPGIHIPEDYSGKPVSRRTHYHPAKDYLPKPTETIWPRKPGISIPDHLSVKPISKQRHYDGVHKWHENGVTGLWPRKPGVSVPEEHSYKGRVNPLYGSIESLLELNAAKYDNIPEAKPIKNAGGTVNEPQYDEK
jgi:hypothetical protein